MNIISLGAGVQSSTMALMAAHGEIGPMPDAAIFADTQAEPPEVYEWLDWLSKQLPFEVIKVTAGNLTEDLIKNKNSTDGNFSSVPFYYEGGMGRRQCTREYKLQPIYKKIREMGASHKNPFNLWVGISTDEAQRMKPARVKYVKNTWPLIDSNMSRTDCLSWMGKNNFPMPPKSACVFCPFSKDHQFREIKIKGGLAWDMLLAVDRAANLRGQYVHRSKTPIDLVDLRSAEDAGQVDMFNEECEGMCGV